MRAHSWTFSLVAAATFLVAFGVPAPDALAAQLEVRVDGTWQSRPGPNQGAYDFGYRAGLQLGEQDGRKGRSFGYERDGTYRSGDRGYNRTFGSRDVFRTEFRRGFAAGYRIAYDRATIRDRRDDRWDRPAPRYQEPAVARGYSDGFEKGLDDGRDRDRYDPVRHGDYREADQGYEREYGSKDAYKNNYRAGFRQGYEDGYREGTRRR
jgi:hypothetical protein